MFLELAGTKWNMNTYFPSIGIGGYCIPISSKCILQGNKNEDYLTLLKNVVDFDTQYVSILCEFINNFGIRKVGILSATYRSDGIILNGSLLIHIINWLKEMGIQVYISDSLFEPTELKEFFNVEPFDVKQNASYSFDGVIVNNWHKHFDNFHTIII